MLQNYDQFGQFGYRIAMYHIPVSSKIPLSGSIRYPVKFYQKFSDISFFEIGESWCKDNWTRA